MFGDPFAAWKGRFASEKLYTAYFVTVVGKRQLSASFRGKFPNPLNFMHIMYKRDVYTHTRFCLGGNLLASKMFLMLMNQT